MRKAIVKFSNIQETAIRAKDGNFLVSAGAGSGKTAVLTERIYRLAKEEKTLDTFLVLTFTNLAAGEMKDRVRKKLLEDEEYSYLASEVDDSHIETFDSFSLFIVKKYFYKLDISSDINILDNSIQTIQRKKILDEVFDELYEDNDPLFLELINEYCIKDERDLKELILSLLLAGDKKADNIAFLKSLQDKLDIPNFHRLFMEDYIDQCKDRLRYLRNKIEELDDFYVAEYKEKALDFIDHVLSIDEYEAFREANLNTFISLGRGKAAQEVPLDIKEEIKAIGAIYNSKVRFFKERDFGERASIGQDYAYTSNFVREILDIALKVEHRLSAFKKELNAFSFGDISRFLLQLLEDEDIRKEISDSFHYIMVDEYQDTNDIQETVINKIAKNNVYMVGDVKQSIYRFRGADCHIFQDKYDRYSKGEGVRIDLNTSYRSRKEVVDFINDIFSSLMDRRINEIDYEDGHHFEFGNKESFVDVVSDENYQPEIYLNIVEKGDDIVKKEADIIAKDILTKLKQGYKVYDKDLKKLRPCNFKDFAIIIDRGTAFNTYAEIISSYNIPVRVVNKEDLLSTDISYVTRSLVKLFYYALEGKYEKEYRHHFLSIARSFLFSYSDDELYKIAKDNKYLLEPFAQKIELIKESLRFASIKEVLNTLFNSFDVYSKIERIGNYYENVHKLETFISLGESMDVLGYTIKDFVNYFDDLDNADADIEHTSKDEKDNSITLINIHKSKGLEYGIIYFPGLYKGFNSSEAKKTYSFSEKYGVSIPVRGEKDSLLRRLIIEENNNADFEEKLRLLYVAFTRSKEKIIIIASQKDDKKKIKYPKDASNMLDIFYIAGDKINKYISEFKPDYDEYKVSEVVDFVHNVTLKEISVPAKVIEKSRASKVASEDTDTSLLSLGTELHSYLEHLDFENPQDFIGASPKMKRYIANVRNSKLFKGVKNSQIRHEYRYYDEDNNIEGYIDCLIIKDNEIDIIDFKFANIDDEAYDKQLRTYKSYIAKISNLPIKMYLLSAVNGKIREVKDE